MINGGYFRPVIFVSVLNSNLHFDICENLGLLCFDVSGKPDKAAGAHLPHGQHAQMSGRVDRYGRPSSQAMSRAGVGNGFQYTRDWHDLSTSVDKN